MHNHKIMYKFYSIWPNQMSPSISATMLVKKIWEKEGYYILYFYLGSVE